MSFFDNRLELPDRMVPLEGELRGALWRLYEATTSRPGWSSPPEEGAHGAGEHLPHGRAALDAEGQTSVRLMDLRHDWILRQLAERDWTEVSRISGVEVPTLQARFSAVTQRKARPARRPGGRVQTVAGAAEERSSPAGLALWLTWQLGLQAREIAALTWDQVDFSADLLRLPDREVPLTNAVRRLLEEPGAAAAPDPPQVLLTNRSRKPVDLPRLSRMTHRP